MQGLTKIARRIGKVDYELKLLMEMNMIHLVFYVSMLRKFMGAPNSTVPLGDVSVEENLAYEEVSLEILD